jgi:hypothetical protein
MTGLGWSAWLKDCTLIARKIEDMTDEELVNLGLAHTWGREYRIDDLIGRSSDDTLLFRHVRKLTSIGVYPFDQSHFETGEVIDIKTLED